MPKISLIAAVDEKNGLGFKGQLLCHLPADLIHFKRVTMGKPIIMGRATFESIGKALPGRVNIVLSKRSISIAGVQLYQSLEDALASVATFPEIMIIGGAQLFQQALVIADTVYLTVIHHKFAADVFFPQLDLSHWQQEKLACQPQNEKNPYAMTFYCYHRSFFSKTI